MFIAYNLTVQPELEVYVSHLTRAGVGWDELAPCGRRVFLGAENALVQSNGETRICADGVSGVFVACANQRSGASQNIYAQRLDMDGNLMWGATGVVVCAAMGDQTFASQTYSAMCPDGDGGCFIVWQDPRTSAGSQDIYMQHLVADGSIAPGWAPDGVAVCSANGAQAQPSVIADMQGGAICVWQDPRSGNLDIYAARIDGTGELVPGWSDDGNLICGATSNQSMPVIASDGVGGAFVAWEDARHLSTETDVDIYAAHVLANGSLDSGAHWQSDGLAVCLASEVQSNPDVVTDGVGGALVAWMDLRLGAGQDVYAQRLSADGSIAQGWQVDGVEVVTHMGDQSAPHLVSDSSGGAIVSWNDGRSLASNGDVYALRLDSTGQVPTGWVSGGNPICTATGNQTVPILAPGDAGGAFVAWRDVRGAFPVSVYVQRVAPDGEAGGEVSVPTASRVGATVSVAPNPVRRVARLTIELAAAERVSVSVFEPNGRRVRELLSSARLDAGRLDVSWDLQDGDGNQVHPGMYLIRVSVGERVYRRSMVVLR